MQLGVGLGLPYNLGKPSAAFSPLDLSPVLWLDAADTSTITESGGAVSQWDDKSGNGNHVTQGTAAAQPTTGTRTINSINVLDFDGGDWLRTATAAVTSQPFTMFVVGHSDSGVSDTMLDSRTAADRVAFVMQLATNLRVLAGSLLSATGATVTGADHIFTAIVDGASSEIFVDASSYGTGNPGANSYEPATVGGSYVNGLNTWDGAIAEIVIVSTVDAADIAAMHAYLADKWGITL